MTLRHCIPVTSSGYFRNDATDRPTGEHSGKGQRRLEVGVGELVPRLLKRRRNHPAAFEHQLSLRANQY